MTNVPAAGRGAALFEAAALMTTAACLAEGALAPFVLCFFSALAFAVSCQLLLRLVALLLLQPCGPSAEPAYVDGDSYRTLGAAVVIGCVACTLSSGMYARD